MFTVGGNQVLITLDEYNRLRDRAKETERIAEERIKENSRNHQERFTKMDNDWRERYRFLLESYQDLEEEKNIPALKEKIQDLAEQLAEELTRPWWKNRKKR